MTTALAGHRLLQSCKTKSVLAAPQLKGLKCICRAQVATELKDLDCICRAQVATELKDLVQHQHQQLRSLHARHQGGEQTPASLGTQQPDAVRSSQGDEMTELKGLIHSLRQADLWSCSSLCCLSVLSAF